MYTTIVTYKPANNKTVAEIEESFQASVPMFSSIPGLIRKYFCFDAEKYEGTSVYLWEDRESAEKCFNSPVFQEGFKAAFDCQPQIKYMETRLVVDNS